jgi:flavin-dependent dehydrogenase
MKIVIIGGGPAGLFTALVLKQMKHEVLVLEAGTYTKQRAGEHLGAEARSLMKSLNIPGQIIENNSIRCTSIAGAWGQKELLSRSSIFNPYGEGLILSRPEFDYALATYCKRLNIYLETNCRVRTLKQTDVFWEIDTKNQQFKANFVVDASGRNSKFSKAFGTSKITHDDLIGISRVLKPKQNQQLTESELLIESAPNGWWYSVQLPSGAVAATFMTSASLFSASGQNQEIFWMNQLCKGKHTSKKIAGYVTSGKTFTQSAKTQILQKITGKRWLAVGDAAMSYDPLSSAGILKGIRMGISAATKINDWTNGNADGLDEYEQSCRKTFAEYLIKKEAYYALEKRFNDCPFWYSRNIRPKSMNNFRVLPHQSLHVLEGNHKDKLNYLAKELPEVNFQTLLKYIDTCRSVQLVLKEYLKKNEEVVLNKHHFQAIESMEQMGIISVA